MNRRLMYACVVNCMLLLATVLVPDLVSAEQSSAISALRPLKVVGEVQKLTLGQGPARNAPGQPAFEDKILHQLDRPTISLGPQGNQATHVTVQTELKVIPAADMSRTAVVNSEGGLENPIIEQESVTEDVFRARVEKGMELRRLLVMASDLGYDSISNSEIVRYANGLEALYAGFDQPTGKPPLFAAEFSANGVTKAVLMKIESGALSLFDESGGITVDLLTGSLTVNGSQLSQQASCDYWKCVGNCLSEIPGWLGFILGIICDVTLQACLLLPNQYTCGAAIACLGGTFGYCLISCGVDVCSYCDCPPDPMQISGRILHEDGTPWSDVQVCVLDCDWNSLGHCSSSAADGTFSISCPSDIGDVRIGFDRGCYPLDGTDCFPAEPGPHPTGDVTLPDCDVSLDVVTGEAGVGVFAMPCATDSVAASCETDGSGTCYLTMVPEDYYLVFVRNCDCYAYYIDCITLTAGDWEVQVSLPACAVQICLEGRIVDTAGSNWPNVTVYAADCSYNALTSDVTDGSGIYSLCFAAQDFQLVFDRACCNGELIGTDCLSIVPCEYVVGDISLDDCPQPPAFPSLVSPADGAPNQPQPVALDWSDVSEATRYQVQVDDNSNFSSPAVNQQPTASNASVSGLAKGTTYYWHVRAYDNCCWGTWSAARSFTTCDCGVWGDVNNDGEVNPVDVVYMVNYVYKNQDARVQPPNCPHEAGDVDCDDAVNPVDVVRYVNYVYKNITPFPCDPCA